MYGQKSKPILLHLSDKQRETLAEAAREQTISQSAVMRILINDHLEKKEM